MACFREIHNVVAVENCKTLIVECLHMRRICEDAYDGEDVYVV